MIIHSYSYCTPSLRGYIIADLSLPEATPELDHNPERWRGDRLKGLAERRHVSEGEHVRQGGWVLVNKSDIGLGRKVHGGPLGQDEQRTGQEKTY